MLNRTQLREKTLIVKNAQRFAANQLTDEQALEAKILYPKWEDLIAEKEHVLLGFRFQYNGDLYRIAAPEYTFDGVYEPSINTTSIFVKITPPESGDDENAPVEYTEGMDLLEGKYYIQNGITYVCTRELLNAVHPLSALVGLYVEVVE